MATVRWAEARGEHHLPPGRGILLIHGERMGGPNRAQALTEQYRQRWTIENQYKAIREHSLPQTATKDYRVRFLYFIIGVILHVAGKYGGSKNVRPVSVIRR